MAYDNICRYLTTEYPANFVRWLLNIDANIIEPLPTELSVNPIRSDALYFLPEQQQILHLEFQTSHTSVPALPLRMLDYWVRLYRQYQCHIEQIVIFLKQTNSDAVYEDRLAIDNTSHRYRVVRLWEQDPTPLLTSTALLPLAVLAQTNLPETLLRQVAERVDMNKLPRPATLRSRFSVALKRAVPKNKQVLSRKAGLRPPYQVPRYCDYHSNQHRQTNHNDYI